jgi:hypothetical protein
MFHNSWHSRGHTDDIGWRISSFLLTTHRHELYIIKLLTNIRYKDRFLKAYQGARERKIGLWKEGDNR